MPTLDKEKNREYVAKYRAKVKADPVLHEEYKAKYTEYNKRWRDKNPELVKQINRDNVAKHRAKKKNESKPLKTIEESKPLEPTYTLEPNKVVKWTWELMHNLTTEQKQEIVDHNNKVREDKIKSKRKKKISV